MKTDLNYVRFEVYPKGQIPQNAPKEVRQILEQDVSLSDSYIAHMNQTSFTCRLPENMMLDKRLEMARKLQKLGYNPLDYQLDPNELALRLKLYNAEQQYTKALFLKDTFTPSPHDMEEAMSNMKWYEILFCNPAKRVKNPYIKQAEQFKEIIKQLKEQISRCPLVLKKTEILNTATKKLVHI